MWEFEFVSDYWSLNLSDCWESLMVRVGWLVEVGKKFGSLSLFVCNLGEYVCVCAVLVYDIIIKGATFFGQTKKKEANRSILSPSSSTHLFELPSYILYEV